MEYVHRISESVRPGLLEELAGIGVIPSVVQPRLVVFEIEESDPRWPEVRQWMVRQRAFDFMSTRFSAQELAEASWLEMMPDWHYGYPQPNEMEFGYLEATYDLHDYCRECGVGKVQKSPFQMRGEPRWGRRSIMQLNWVFDEYFVRPEVWSAAFEPLGVGCRTVLAARGEELATVVQLVVEDSVDIVAEGLTAQTCPKCGRVKYEPVTRGQFPPLVADPAGAIAKTSAWFGSGASAHRPVLITQRLRQAMLAKGVRGASMQPVAPTL